MQSIQQFGRLAATAAIGLMTCAVASGCGKKDAARTNAATQNTAAANQDTTLRSSQAGTIPAESANTTPPATPSTSTGRESTTSLGGSVPAPTRRSSARRSAVATTSVAAASTSPSNREPDVSGRSATVSTDTSAAGSKLNTVADPTFLAEPQIYTIVFLANMGDSSASARAICRNPTVTGSTPTALDEQVRTFAQRMVNDHGQLNRRVAELQRTKNIIPTRSDVSDQVFSANSEAMGINENSRDYIAREVLAHQHTLNTLDTRLIPNARDSSLRVLLVEARALVQNHLNEAQRIQSGATAANTSSSAQPMHMSLSPARPDTIRANSNATVYQSPTTNATASAAITTTTPTASVTATTTAPSDATKPATSSALNPASTTPVAQQYATAPTSAPAAQPCDTSRPIPTTSTTPSVSPSIVAPIRADTTRGYDSRAATTPPTQPAPAPVKP